MSPVVYGSSEWWGYCGARIIGVSEYAIDLYLYILLQPNAYPNIPRYEENERIGKQTSRNGRLHKKHHRSRKRPGQATSLGRK